MIQTEEKPFGWLTQSPIFYAEKVENLKSMNGNFSSYKNAIIDVFMSDILHFLAERGEDDMYKTFCDLRDIYFLFLDFDNADVEHLQAQNKALSERIMQLEKVLQGTNKVRNEQNPLSYSSD